MADPMLRRTEVKAFFANERTFLHWLHMSVTVGGIAAAILGLASHGHKHWDLQVHYIRVIALAMLLLAIILAAYTAVNFFRRIRSLESKVDGPYDAHGPPVLLGVVLLAVLGVAFWGALTHYKHWDTA